MQNPSMSRTAGEAIGLQAHKDIFEKCRKFNRAKELQASGLYMYFEVFGDREGCGPGEIRLAGKKVLMFGSNDYLDLSQDPRVKEAAAAAIIKYGTGCSGSPLLNGTLRIHVQLEEELADFSQKENCMLFGTGFQANYAVLGALAERGEVLLCEHNLHSSLIDGGLRSTARTVRFGHNDLTHLEDRLQSCPAGEPVLIVTESIFSMEGDMADLAGITRLAARYGARTYVDEAHGIGILGRTGAGVAEHQGVLDQVDIIMGTFSKSLAAAGGFVASSAPVIHYLKHVAHPFVFSASIPPASVGAVRAALKILIEEPERRQKLLGIADLLRRELRSLNFHVLNGHSPVVPIVLKNGVDLCRLSKALLEEGIYVNPILRPAAAHNLLRVSCTAAHSEAHVDRFVTTIDRLAKKLQIERHNRAKASTAS